MEDFVLLGEVDQDSQNEAIEFFGNIERFAEFHSGPRYLPETETGITKDLSMK